MNKIAVIIPCFNEEKTIGKVVTDFRDTLPEAEIYVYDNNSSDGSDDIAKSAGAIVVYEHQQGKGNVIRRAFSEIDAECYVLVDGDDTYPAEAAKMMIQSVLIDRVDMVVGDRLSSTYYKQNKRPFHNFGNLIVKWSINTLFRSNIQDIMTGFRAFSYRFVKTFPVLSKGFELETEMSIHAVDKNMYVENAVIDYRDRPDGSESKLNTYEDGIKVLITILRLFMTYRPGAFFGTVSLALAMLSIAYFIPVFITYTKTGEVDQFPTLIVCGFVMLSAILSLFMGLLLRTINQKNRQDFEMNLYRVTSELTLKQQINHE